MASRGWSFGVLMATSLLAACPAGKPAADAALARDGHAPCGGLEGTSCHKAEGMVRAASGFGNVRHEYLIDPASAMEPGRCISRAPGGAYEVLPAKCAEGKAAGAAASDQGTVDFTYVGIAVDHHLLSADADLVPWASVGAAGGEKKVSLVAMAFVRDRDPQYFSAASEVAFDGKQCAHGRATHFVGAVKVGGMLAYEMQVRGAELRGAALSFFKARLAAGDKRITQTVIGGLEVDGLEAATGSASAEQAASATDKPLTFRVKNPVPVAYAVYPLADVCKFAFPAPEVSPELVELGDVPYGQAGQKLLHVVNRANLDVRADFAGQSFALPALASIDLPVSWTPTGASLGCERQEREETLQFSPKDSAAPVSPKTQSVRITERVRTGKGTFSRQEHVDTGVYTRPDYAQATRAWECPADYALKSCRTENLQCGDASCTEKGYAVNASPEGNGCKFTCNGPKGIIPGLSSYFCRFDAVMECGLRCR